jgi:hypothetical protein
MPRGSMVSGAGTARTVPVSVVKEYSVLKKTSRPGPEDPRFVLSRATINPNCGPIRSIPDPRTIHSLVN